MNHPSHATIYIKSPLCPLWALWQAKKMKNEPNSPSHRHTFTTKRTQFQPPRTCGRPKNAKRTQFRPPSCLNSTKRTQFAPTPTSIMRNEPNLHAANTRNEPNPSPAHDKKCKTNPISDRQKHETNPIRARSTTKKCETNPIYRLATRPRPKNTKRTQFQPGKSTKRTQSPCGQGPGTPGYPHYAKQTQSQPCRPKRLTISRVSP